MGKFIFAMTRLTVLLGFLAAVPSIATLNRAVSEGKFAGLAKAVEGLRACRESTASGSQGLGKDSDFPSPGVTDVMPNLMDFVSRQTGTSEKPNSAPAPRGPMTVIRYVGPEHSRQKKAGAAVMHLPPDANAAIVDGRVQVFYPSPKPGAKP